MRWLRRILLVVVLLPVAVGVALFLWLRTSLPQTSGTLTLAGIAAPVTVERDESGVPTIRAGSARDAAFALGFVHAQERLFQMDLMRRYGAGRLSEVFGAPALPVDREMRVLGFYRLAERQVALMSPEARAVLDAYAAGVNAFLAKRSGALPPEYYLLRFEPEPWKPADSLVWAKIMALELSANYRGELFRARLIRKVSPEQLQQLYPEYPKDGAIALGNLAALYRTLPLDRLRAEWPDAAAPRGASNNWVVDGKHSASGKPLLANDPHLGFNTPGTWYLARIETPQWHFTGVTAPGVPFGVIGHNGRLAWGFTTTGSDVEDLFVERVDPADPNRYLTPDGSQPFGTRQEVIRVRDAAPVTLTVRSTRHGPVISDASTAAAATAAAAGTEGSRVLALTATFLMEDDRTPQAFWDLGQAGDVESADRALESIVAPQQNIVLADVDGHIAFVAPARVPIRAKGNGWLPVPGWTGEYDWTGFIPYDKLPRTRDPASGRVVTANNKIVPDSYPYFLTRDWDIPNRADRINRLLDERPVQSPDASAAIQADTLSLMARHLLPLMLRAKPSNARARAAMDRLAAWDGEMEMEKAEPLIFAAWLRELVRTLAADELGDLFGEYWDFRPLAVRGMLAHDNSWCDDVTTPRLETCGERVALALDRALDDLDRRYGDDMAGWSWGHAHPATFPHPVFSRVPLLKDMLAVKIPAAGGSDTVNLGAMAIGNPETPYADIHGAGLRAIFDLADLDSARFMIVPGQSGNPFSPHYTDLLRPWRDFAWLHPGKAAAKEILHLVPQ
jgi:penicillin amidase